MNQLNKNRLLGGAVLVFASLFFAPAILTPKPHNLDNPAFVVNMDKNQAKSTPSITLESNKQNTVKPDAKLANKNAIPTQSPLKLESLANSKGQQLSLESTRQPQKVAVALKKTASNAPKKQPTQSPSTNNPQALDWLQVGSFGNKKNASELLNTLKANYPVKLETAKVDGKLYHRVLVGPFSDDKKRNSARAALLKVGYKPSLLSSTQ